MTVPQDEQDYEGFFGILAADLYENAHAEKQQKL